MVKCSLVFSVLCRIMGLLNQCEEQMAVLYNIIASKQSRQGGRQRFPEPLLIQGHHSEQMLCIHLCLLSNNYIY